MEVHTALTPQHADGGDGLPVHQVLLGSECQANSGSAVAYCRRSSCTDPMWCHHGWIPPAKPFHRPHPGLRRGLAAEPERRRPRVVHRRALRDQRVPARAARAAACPCPRWPGSRRLVVPPLRVEQEDRRPRADRAVVPQPLALRNDLAAVHPDPQAVRPAGAPASPRCSGPRRPAAGRSSTGSTAGTPDRPSPARGRASPTAALNGAGSSRSSRCAPDRARSNCCR